MKNANLNVFMGRFLKIITRSTQKVPNKVQFDVMNFIPVKNEGKYFFSGPKGVITIQVTGGVLNQGGSNFFQ